MLDEKELLFDELYEKTKDCGRVQFIKLLMQKERENNELRERLVENSKINIADHKYASECEDKVITMENQQKEFIEYLESEIKRLEENNIYEPLQRTALATFQHVLSKYKEIIGVKDE